VTAPAKPTRAASARDDAGAAAEVDDRRSAGQIHHVEVGVSVADEGRILAAELEPLDEPLERRGVLLVDELHRVACLHVSGHGALLRFAHLALVGVTSRVTTGRRASPGVDSVLRSV
jgi:hypothetical protein